MSHVVWRTEIDDAEKHGHAHQTTECENDVRNEQKEDPQKIATDDAFGG